MDGHPDGDALDAGAAIQPRRMRRAHLLLVSPGAVVRPPLAVASRPELQAAFEQGTRDRIAHGAPPADELHERSMSFSADERSAYLLGVAGDNALRAPAPLAIAVPLHALDLVIGLLLDGPSTLRRRLLRFAICAPLIALSFDTLGRAEHRRATELGLTALTAPRAAHPAQLVAPVVLALLSQLWHRRRGGRRTPAVTPSEAAAANLVRAIRRRYDWHRAYRRGL